MDGKEEKKQVPAVAPKAAFLMLELNGRPGPQQVPDVPSPRGTDGWTPGVPVALKDIGRAGITPTRAKEIVKSTGLFALTGPSSPKGAEKK